MNKITRAERAVQRERKRVLRILRTHRYALEQVMLWPRLENLVRNGYDALVDHQRPVERRTLDHY